MQNFVVVFYVVFDFNIKNLLYKSIHKNKYKHSTASASSKKRLIIQAFFIVLTYLSFIRATVLPYHQKANIPIGCYSLSFPSRQFINSALFHTASAFAET